MPPLCTADRLEKELCIYTFISMPEILAWHGSWLDRLQTSPGPFGLPETTVGATVWNEIQERRRSENHFPFDEEIWLPWHAEVISYIAVRDATRSPRSLEPGLRLWLTPALGQK